MKVRVVDPDYLSSRRWSKKNCNCSQSPSLVRIGFSLGHSANEWLPTSYFSSQIIIKSRKDLRHTASHNNIICSLLPKRTGQALQHKKRAVLPECQMNTSRTKKYLVSKVEEIKIDIPTVAVKSLPRWTGKRKFCKSPRHLCVPRKPENQKILNGSPRKRGQFVSRHCAAVTKQVASPQSSRVDLC